MLGKTPRPPLGVFVKLHLCVGGTFCTIQSCRPRVLQRGSFGAAEAVCSLCMGLTGPRFVRETVVCAHVLRILFNYNMAIQESSFKMDVAHSFGKSRMTET